MGTGPIAPCPNNLNEGHAQHAQGRDKRVQVGYRDQEPVYDPRSASSEYTDKDTEGGRETETLHRHYPHHPCEPRYGANGEIYSRRDDDQGHAHRYHGSDRGLDYKVK
jgi:hypothetical protein